MIMNPALFIERDGVLIHNGYDNDITHIRLIRTAGNAIAEFNSMGIPIILIVEQSKDNANKLLTKQIAETMEDNLKRKLKRLGAHYTLMLVHPNPPESIEDYKKEDLTQKSSSAKLIEKAARLCNIDIKNSWIVTNKFKTLLEAKRTEMLGGILVKTGKIRSQEKILEANLKELHPFLTERYSSLQIARTKLLKYYKEFY